MQRPATDTAACTAAGRQTHDIGATGVGGRLLRGDSLGEQHSLLLGRHRALSSSSHAAATAAVAGGAIRASTWLHRSMTTAADGDTWCLSSSGSSGGGGAARSSSFTLQGGSGRGSSSTGGGDGGGARGSSSVAGAHRGSLSAVGAHRGSGRRETDLERLSRMVSSGPGQGMSRESPCISRPRRIGYITLPSMDVSVDQARTPPSFTPVVPPTYLPALPSVPSPVPPHPAAITGADDHQWPASGCRHGRFEGEARRGRRRKGVNMVSLRQPRRG